MELISLLLRSILLQASLLLTIIPTVQGDEPEKVPTLTRRQKADIKEFIEAVLKCSRIQGLNLAVVNKDEVLMLEGFGFADVESDTPVTTSTLFPIASTSKGFTATLLALLLHETTDERGNQK